METGFNVGSTTKQMKYKKTIISVTVIGLIGILTWTVFFRLPSTYSAEPIEGWVVDAETKEPIEGAIVIALWELERPYSLEGSIPAGTMQVTEVLTDAKGRYFIQAWGPKKRPGRAYLSHSDPRLVVFKDGYDYFAKGNSYISILDDNRRESIHRSDWHGKTIELEKFQWLDKEWGLKAYHDRIWRMVNSLDSVLNQNFGARKCDWKMIPLMALTLNEYDEKFDEKNLSNWMIPDLKHLNWENQCGNIDAYLKEYVK